MAIPSTTPAATARCRTIVGLGIRPALVNRSPTGGRLHQAENQGLHLQFPPHAPAESDLHLALHTHPVHLRGLATGVAGELLPAVLKHPLDLTLGPERHLAGIGSGDHPAQVHPWRRHHRSIRADGGQDRDNPVFRQLLALLEHAGIDDAVAGLIEQLDPGLDRVTLTDRISGELHHITVVDDQGVVFRHTHRVAGPGVLHQHAVLAVHGHEELGLGEGEHQLLVLLEAVTGHVNALALAVNHLGPEHHQPVDGVDHGNGVAGNRTGRKNDGVGALDLHLRVLATGDPAQRRQGLALAAGHQQERFTVR